MEITKLRFRLLEVRNDLTLMIISFLGVIITKSFFFKFFTMLIGILLIIEILTLNIKRGKNYKLPNQSIERRKKR